MKKEQLQGLRKALFLDVKEAAELIGNVSPRSWQYWESGDRPVPQDVEEKMLNLSRLKNDAEKAVLDEGFEYSYKYYDFESFCERFGNNKIAWRLYQAVLTALFQILGDNEKENPAPEDCALYSFFEKIEL